MLYARHAAVEAVAMSGSRSAQMHDEQSDIDLYVYCSQALPLKARAAIVESRASPTPRAEVGNQFFESGDEWKENGTGIALDVMFRDTRWLEDQMQRVFVRHEAWVGHTTCFWHNVRRSEILFDRAGWFTALHAQAQQPYPETLRRAIIAKNYPLLRDNISSFAVQIKKALRRNDIVSVNHRITAFLASYFDVLFALNALTHPGEKRLLRYATEQCSLLPPTLTSDVELLLSVVGLALTHQQAAENALQQAVERLVDGLTPFLQDERLL
jgi:hypothetical protein